MTGRAIAYPGGGLYPGGKTPRVGSRCTGTLSAALASDPADDDTAAAETAGGPVEVLVVNDLKAQTELLWSRKGESESEGEGEGAQEVHTIHPGQARRLLAQNIGDELSLVPQKGKKKGRRPRALRFQPSHGSQQTVLLSSMMAGKGSRAGTGAASRRKVGGKAEL